MPDIATLGLRVEAGDVVKADAALNRLASSADKAETSTKKLTSATNNLSPASRGVSGAFSQTEQTLIKTTAAHEKHTLATGRAIRALEGLSVEALGANHQMATLGVVLGEFGAGHGVVLAALAGVAALAYAYEKLTASAEKAEEAQKKLTAAAKDFLDKQGRPAGDLGGALTLMGEDAEETRKKIDALQKRRDDLLAGGPLAKGGQRQLNTVTTQLEDENRKYAEQQAAIKALTPEINRLTDASKSAAELADVQIARINALTGAHAADAYAIARLNIQYDLHAKLLQNAAQYTGAQLRDMNLLAEAEAAALTRQAYFVTGTAAANGNAEALALALPKLQAAFHALTPEMVKGTSVQQDIINGLEQLKKDYPETIKRIREIATANERTAHEQIDAAAAAIKAAQDYHDKMEKIFRSGLERVLSHGMKSYQDFFGDVLSMFSSMMDAMEEEAKKHNTTPGGAFKALGVASAGIGGALAGYDIGHSTGSAVLGAAGGALSGFELGNSILPGIGGVVGGLAGLAGGLFGASRAAKEAAAALDQLKQLQLQQTLAAWKASVTGLASDQRRANELDLKYKYLSIRQTIEQVEAGKKMEDQRNKDLAEADAIYAEAQKKLTDSTNALTGAMENAVNGYRYQAAIFGGAPFHAPPTPPVTGNSGYTGGSGNTSGSGGDLTVHVVLPDGSALGTAVLKDFKRRAGSQFRDTTKWGQIQ